MSHVKKQFDLNPISNLGLVIVIFAFLLMVPAKFSQAQEKSKSTKIEIDAKDKTDTEVKAEIEEKLKARGATNPQVSVETKADGMRQISVGIKDSSDTKMTEKRIELEVSGDDLSFDADHEISIDTEGKTDEQIKEEIKKKLAVQGNDDAEVTVTTDSDGQHRIEVKVEKEKEE
ncbi:MAG: hypothetical protein V3W18_13425 [candidate division Zixibacteria bacterium]